MAKKKEYQIELKAENKELQKRLRESSKELDKLKRKSKETQDSFKSFGKGFSAIAGSVTGLVAPILSTKVAFDEFTRVMERSQSAGDEFRNTIEGIREGLTNWLSSDFTSSLSDFVKSAKELAEFKDSLGNFNMSKELMESGLIAEIQDIRTQIVEAKENGDTKLINALIEQEKEKLNKMEELSKFNQEQITTYIQKTVKSTLPTGSFVEDFGIEEFNKMLTLSAKRWGDDMKKKAKEFAKEYQKNLRQMENANSTDYETYVKINYDELNRQVDAYNKSLSQEEKELLIINQLYDKLSDTQLQDLTNQVKAAENDKRQIALLEKKFMTDQKITKNKEKEVKVLSEEEKLIESMLNNLEGFDYNLLNTQHLKNIAVSALYTKKDNTVLSDTKTHDLLQNIISKIQDIKNLEQNKVKKYSDMSIEQLLDALSFTQGKINELNFVGQVIRNPLKYNRGKDRGKGEFEMSVSRGEIRFNENYKVLFDTLAKNIIDEFDFSKPLEDIEKQYRKLGIGLIKEWQQISNMIDMFNPEDEYMDIQKSLETKRDALLNRAVNETNPYNKGFFQKWGDEIEMNRLFNELERMKSNQNKSIDEIIKLEQDFAKKQFEFFQKYSERRNADGSGNSIDERLRFYNDAIGHYNPDSSEWKDLAETIGLLNAQLEQYNEKLKESTEIGQFKSGEIGIWNAMGSSIQSVSSALSAFDEDTKGFIQTLTVLQNIALATAAAMQLMNAAQAISKGISTSSNWIEAIVAIGSLTAAIIGSMSALKGTARFERGGVVGGGSYSGDHNLVRVNSGEVIFTNTQFKELVNFVHNNKGMNGDVKFVIEGSTLVGVINNTNRRNSRCL